MVTFSAFALSLSVRVAAQLPAALSFTLEQAKEHAVKYNRTLQKAGIAVEEAHEALWQAISAGLPKVDATVDYSNYLGFNMSLQGMSIAFNPTSSAKATLSQLVFSGAYWVGIDMAKIARKISEKSIEKTELDVKENVTLTYYAILLARQNKEILLGNIANLRDIHKRTDDLARAEIVEKTNADQIAVQVMNLEAALHSLDRQTELAYNMLRLHLGLAPGAELSVVGGIDDHVAALASAGLDGKVFDLAGNIDFRLLKSQEELQQQQIRLDRAAYLPTISGFYSYTYKIIKPAFDMSPPHVLGLQANIPIFSSFQRRSKVRQSEIKLRALQTDIEQVADQLNIQEKQLRYNLRNASEQYEIQRRNVEVSKRVFDNSVRKHEYGAISSLDLTTANNNYLQAESNMLSSKNELLKAQTELLKLLGEL
jgi:outer membrane protein TolC